MKCNMANRQDLKRKLRASDRRRRRRSVDTSDNVTATTNVQSASTNVDVCGLIVGTILDFADSCPGGTRDVVIIAALRGCLNSSTPSGEQSNLLYQRLDAIAGQGGVDMRSFRVGLSEVIDLAHRHQDSKNTQAFVRYLAVLAE